MFNRSRVGAWQLEVAYHAVKQSLVLVSLTIFGKIRVDPSENKSDCEIQIRYQLTIYLTTHKTQLFPLVDI